MPRDFQFTTFPRKHFLFIFEFNVAKWFSRHNLKFENFKFFPICKHVHVWFFYFTWQSCEMKVMWESCEVKIIGQICEVKLTLQRCKMKITSLIALYIFIFSISYTIQIQLLSQISFTTLPRDFHFTTFSSNFFFEFNVVKWFSRHYLNF